MSPIDFFDRPLIRDALGERERVSLVRCVAALPTGPLGSVGFGALLELNAGLRAINANKKNAAAAPPRMI
jgi:hypothetical protein